MELWIRSQDKTQLAQITGLLLNDNEIRGFTNYHQNYYELGTYKTKERALQILDEINNKIKNQFIVKVNTLLKPNDVKKLKDELEMNYIGDFIMENQMIDIKPITQNVIYYEMPEQ